MKNWPGLDKKSLLREKVVTGPRRLRRCGQQRVDHFLVNSEGRCGGMTVTLPSISSFSEWRYLLGGLEFRRLSGTRTLVFMVTMMDTAMQMECFRFGWDGRQCFRVMRH